MFSTILKAIKSGEPGLLELASLDPEEAAPVVKSLFDPRNFSERYVFCDTPLPKPCPLLIQASVRFSVLYHHLRVVIPSFFHEAADSWLIQQYSPLRVRGLIKNAPDEAIAMPPSLRILTRNYVGSVKELNRSFIPLDPNRWCRDLPSPALKSG
ncbi:hypothetical protein B9Z19DRAFT_1133281 [Tuber borchii]|uniref:Uncharacterized protein n=1 Tax=Tuber borchii TaxID=42251 RepID=A0A2T6ZG60_TUBBO|nr:hypothetical protein B9Z19DRAFT_1133281 [Tuber borchii]